MGAIGKLLATSITYPYITIKSRMHVAKAKEGGGQEGMAKALGRAVREEGWGGLYKGMLIPDPFTRFAYLNYCPFLRWYESVH